MLLTFLKNVKITVGIHDERLCRENGPTSPLDEKTVEELTVAIANVVRNHIHSDSYVTAKYDKEFGIKVNS